MDFKLLLLYKVVQKGIWLWGTPKNSLKGNEKIIFLGNEGTSNTDKSTNIDENDISKLSLATHLSNSITTNTNIIRTNY